MESPLGAQPIGVITPKCWGTVNNSKGEASHLVLSTQLSDFVHTAQLSDTLKWLAIQYIQLFRQKWLTRGLIVRIGTWLKHPSYSRQTWFRFPRRVRSKS